MTAQVPEDIQVRDAADHVEVVGISVAELNDALTLYRAARNEQTAARTALYQINRAMLTAEVPLVQPVTQRQVQRETALREDLLSRQGFETYETLAQKRGTTQSSARVWVGRRRDELQLFTVKVKGRTLIPAVLIAADGELDHAVSKLVTPLLAAEMDNWAIWAWLCSPTGLLSGEVPAGVAQINPERAQRAAERAAAEIRHARSLVE